MPINRPYRRTCRQFVDGKYTEGGRWEYMVHPRFAQSPEHYVRAFLLLLKDLRELFDYVEPADKNLGCYSYRIHSLLLRACVEVEANCKAILKENGYSPAGKRGGIKTRWDMSDYRKVEPTHLLSFYQVQVPNWTGSGDMRSPFLAWRSGSPLPWYEAYHATKHDRHIEFDQATFEHLIDACCGLLVVLTAQFATNDFSPEDEHMTFLGSRRDGMKSGIGGYFRVKYPDNWPADERYDFDWQKLNTNPDPFENYPY